MLRIRIALALVILLVAGCGGNGDRSPAGVVRAWSAALNASDNEGAARLFARDARVVQGTDVLVLHSHEDAVLWNASLPCSGKIVALVRRGYDVTATFLLADRKESICDGPGQEAVAIFRVRRGRIVLWHQLEHGSDSAPSA